MRGERDRGGRWSSSSSSSSPPSGIRQLWRRARCELHFLARWLYMLFLFMAFCYVVFLLYFFFDDEESSLLMVNGGHSKSGIVVTGGLGKLGLEFVRSLILSNLRPVIILDIRANMRAYDNLLREFPSETRRTLILHEIDVRDKELVNKVFSKHPHIRGVVHLAQVSDASWCFDNKELCEEINIQGTINLIEALNQHSSGDPWLILGSSLEVERFFQSSSSFSSITPTPSSPSPFSSYEKFLAKSKLQAENVLRSSLTLPRRLRKGSILRFSSVYGGTTKTEEKSYSASGSLIDILIKRSIIGLPLEVFTPYLKDYIHVSDAVSAIEFTVDTLEGRKGDHPFIKTFAVSSGEEVSLDSLVERIVSLTNSSSPIRRFDLTEKRSGVEKEKEELEEAIPFKFTRAQVTLDIGLRGRYVAFLKEGLSYVRQQLQKNCPTTKWMDEDLEALNGCTVSIVVNHTDGVMKGLICGDQWYLRNLTLELSDQIEVQTWKELFGGKRRMSLGCTLKGWAGFKSNNLEGSNMTSWEDSSGAMVDWEPLLDPRTGLMKFLVPGTDLELAPGVDETYLHLRRNIPDVWNFRIVPICCQNSNTRSSDKSLLELHPLFANIQYPPKRTEILFNHTIPELKCEFLRAAETHLERQFLNSAKASTRRGLSSYSTDIRQWKKHNQTVCMNDCSHPLICIDTGDCQCVHDEKCSFDSTPNYLSKLSVDYRRGRQSILKLDMPPSEAIAQVIFPRLRPIIDSISWPKVHMLKPRIWNWKYIPEECSEVRDKHCFLEDWVVYRAIDSQRIPPQEADLFLAPMFHGCIMHYSWKDPIRVEPLIDKARQIKGFSKEKVMQVFSHDWGACISKSWTFAEAKEEGKLKRHPSIETGIALQPMSDYNTGSCYWPHRDIVIPPYTCLTPKFRPDKEEEEDTKEDKDRREEEEDWSKPTPVGERKVLASFAGSFWGSGAFARMSLSCKRRVPSKTLITKWGEAFPSYKEYFQGMLQTRFCPLPSGTTGWSTRFIDAVYLGCIPVLMSDRSHYPFSEVLDYSKFSIRVSEMEIESLENLLLSYDLEFLEQLQRNLLLVREAFLYSSPEKAEEEVKEENGSGEGGGSRSGRRGPVYFMMIMAQFRTKTEYPTTTAF